MPLYEIVLRFADRDELRLADRDGYQVGDKLNVARRGYVVVAIEPPHSPNASKRFVLEPLDSAPPGG